MVAKPCLDRQKSLERVRRSLDAGNLAFQEVDIPDWVEDDLDADERAPLCLDAAGNGFVYQLILYTYVGYPDHKYVLHIDRQDGDNEMYAASMQLTIRLDGSGARVSSEWEYNEPAGKDVFDPRFRALQRFAVRDRPPSDFEGGLAYIERVLATLSLVGTA